MEDFIVNLLIASGCDDTVIKTFAENNLDKDKISKLSRENLKPLIPKMGPRIRFFMKFHEFLESQKNACTSSNSKDSNSSGTPSTSKSNEGQPDINKFHQVDVTLPKFEISENQNLVVTNQNDKADKNLTGTKRRTSSANKISEKRRRVEKSFEQPPIFVNGVKSFLAESVQGRKVLKCGTVLNQQARQELVRCVVDHLLQNYSSSNNLIRVEFFEKASEEIILAYPKEQKETYFESGKSKTKTSPKTLHRGKLWSRYCNTKKQLEKIPEIEENEEEEPVLKAKWKGLRDTFRAELKKELVYQKSNYHRNRPVWIHFKSLQFLKEQMVPRPPIWERNCTRNSDNDRSSEDADQNGSSANKDDNLGLDLVNGDTQINIDTVNHQVEVKQEPEEHFQNLEFHNVSENLAENEMMLQNLSPEQVLMGDGDSITDLNVDPLEGNRCDDNYFFLMSLLPHIRTLPAERRMLLRMQMQELVYKEVYKKSNSEKESSS